MLKGLFRIALTQWDGKIFGDQYLKMKFVELSHCLHRDKQVKIKIYINIFAVLKACPGMPKFVGNHLSNVFKGFV